VILLPQAVAYGYENLSFQVVKRKTKTIKIKNTKKPHASLGFDSN
jgi:hypothetical protein